MASASAMKQKENSAEILANSLAKKKVDGRPECGAVYGMRCRCPRCHPDSNVKGRKKRDSKMMQPSPVSTIFGSSTTKEFEQVSTAKAKIPPRPPAKDIRSKTISQQLPSNLSPAQAPERKLHSKTTFKQLQQSRESLNSHKDLISDSDEELVNEPPEFFDEEADDNDQKWMQTRLRGLSVIPCYAFKAAHTSIMVCTGVHFIKGNDLTITNWIVRESFEEI